MATMVRVDCEVCGYEGSYGSQAKAEAFFPKHSCERYLAGLAHAAQVAAAKEVERPVRDCEHKRVKHEHGTPTAYVLDRCRCVPCTTANTAREKRRELDRQRGTYDSGRVDARPVRDHIVALREAGYGLKQLAKVAKVSNATLGKIVYGDPSRKTPPRARVEKHVADRVLAVKPSLSTLGETTLVKSADTVARIQHLVCMGYSIGWLAGRSGMTNNSLFRMMDHDVCQAKTARTVRQLFLQFGDKPRLGDSRHEAAATTRAIRYAADRGWALIPLPNAPASVTEAPVEPETGLDWFMKQRQDRMHSGHLSTGIKKPGAPTRNPHQFAAHRSAASNLEGVSS